MTLCLLTLSPTTRKLDPYLEERVEQHRRIILRMIYMFWCACVRGSSTARVYNFIISLHIYYYFVIKIIRLIIPDTVKQARPCVRGNPLWPPDLSAKF